MLADYQFQHKLPDSYLREITEEQTMLRKGHDRYFDRLRKMARTSVQPGPSKVVDAEAKAVSEAITKQIEDAQERNAGREPPWLPFVTPLCPDVLAMVALSVFMDGVGHQNGKQTLLVRLGRAIEMERWGALLRAYDSKLEKRIIDKVMKDHSSMRYRWTAAKGIARAAGAPKVEPWSDKEACRHGEVLFNAVMSATDLFEFWAETVPTNKGGFKDVSRVCFTEGASARIASIHEDASWCQPMFAPMIAPPIPWSTFSDLENVNPFERTAGAYLDPALGGQLSLVRGACNEQKRKVQQAIDDGSLDPMLQALNAMQAVPFEINGPILEAVDWAWSEGKVFGKFPRRDMPVMEMMDEERWEQLSDAEKQDYRRIRRERVAKQREIEGSIQVMLSDLSVAKNLFAGEHIDPDDPNTRAFYLPQSWDFRSRVYPIPMFNHQRADHVRAMFQFHRKKPITEKGFLYVALKLVDHGDFNKISKLSLTDRWQWVEDNQERLIQIAGDFKGTFDGDDPNQIYWSKASSPFQFLAACVELRNVAIHGYEYESGFPIGLDGSNSGVQHFSALNRSYDEGALVNLVPQEVPADIYKTVATRTQEKMEAEIASDPEHADASSWLDHGVTRSLVKRNVMTFVYSSAQLGFKEQIMQDFMKPINDDILLGGKWEGNDHNPFSRDNWITVKGTDVMVNNGPDKGKQAAMYLAKINWSSVNEIIVRAARGMNFIRAVSSLVTSQNKNFGFTTPLGFPMVQRYMKQRSEKVRPFLYDKELGTTQRRQVTIRVPQPDTVDPRKSSNAASPNWIHCLDSMHLHATVLKCLTDYDIKDFMMIHDSFATVPADAPHMFEAVRESFIEQYDSGCLYQSLLDQAVAQLDDTSGIKLPKIPEKGRLDLNNIRDSYYCFI